MLPIPLLSQSPTDEDDPLPVKKYSDNVLETELLFSEITSFTRKKKKEKKISKHSIKR